MEESSREEHATPDLSVGHPAAPGVASRMGRRGVPALVLILWGALAILYLPPLIGHIRHTLEPGSFSDDSCIHVAPYLRLGAPPDYTTRYFIACHPLGYRAAMTVAAWGWDPRPFSVVLTYLLLALLVAAGAVTCGRIAGPVAAWAAAAFLLSSPAFLDRLTGGLPRGFLSPLLATFAAVFVSGNIPLALALVVVSMAFNPVVGVIGGLALGLTLLALPARWRGNAADWSWRRRLTALGITALLAALVHCPVSLATRPFGPALTRADWKEYPEAAPGGRSAIGVGDPWQRELPRLVRGGVVRGVTNRHAPLLPGWGHAATNLLRKQPAAAWGLAALLFGGLIWHARWRFGSGPLLALLAASLFAYAAARLVYPLLFHPDRYVSYSISLLAVFALALTAAALGEILSGAISRLRKRNPTPEWVSPALSTAVAVLALLSLGGRLQADTGTDHLGDSSLALMAFVHELPESSLIAGYPPLLDVIPLKAGRRVLVSRETQLPYHKAFVDHNRVLMHATIDALYATNTAPLRRLREEFGVTHLASMTDLYSENVNFRLFSPYNAWCWKAWQQAKTDGHYEVLRQRTGAQVYAVDSVFILDLRRLTPEEPRPSAESIPWTGSPLVPRPSD